MWAGARACSTTRSHWRASAAACCFLIFASCEIVQSCNANLTHFGNVGRLLKRWWELQWPVSLHAWLMDMTSHPMHVAGNAALTASVVFALRMVFKLVDENGDGKLDGAELRRALRRFGRIFSWGRGVDQL